MKKFYLLLLLPSLFFTPSASKAQIRCASTFNPTTIKSLNPSRYSRYIQLENFTQNYITALKSGKLINDNSKIIIPVVVHVLHNGEAIGVGNNISDAQIQSQITVLNEDFRRLNADRINTPAAFANMAADPNIEFRLACIDPNGNSTNGIHRVLTSIVSFTVVTNADGSVNEQASKIKFTSLGGTDAWPTSKYLNIWVCNITPDVNAQLLGYAQFPFDYSAKPNTDGVVILNTAFGRVGNLRFQYDEGRTTTHEVGHWLNLFHIWGDDGNLCSGSDQCNDTPNQGGPNQSNCPAFPHISCSNGPNGDMFMNYMDYTIDACKNIFTQDQRNRMRAVFLTGGPRASFINNYFHVNPQSTPICTTGQISVTNLSCLAVTWSVVSGPVTIQSGQGTKTVTLQKTGNGPAVIKATAAGYVDQTTVEVGIPPYTYDIVPQPISQHPICYKMGTTYTFKAQPMGSDPNYASGTYYWLLTRTDPSPAQFHPASTTNTVGFTFPTEGTWTLQVRRVNSCGNGPYSTYNEDLIVCSTALSITAIPNPANTFIETEIFDFSKNLSSKIKIKKILLIDKTGTVQYQKEFNNELYKVRVPLERIKSDVYILKVYDGKNWYLKKIVVQH